MSPEEWLDASRLHFRPGVLERALGLAAGIMAIGLLVYGIYPGVFGRLEVQAILLSVALIAFALRIWWAPRWEAARACQALRKRSTSTAVNAVTPEGIEYHVAGGVEKIVPWTSFVAWKASDSTLNLYHSTGDVEVFPRRSFRTDQDWRAFIELVQHNVRRYSAQKGPKQLKAFSSATEGQSGVSPDVLPGEGLFLELKLDEGSIVSAYRMIFLHSSRLKLLAGIGICGLVFLFLSMNLARHWPPFAPDGWPWSVLILLVAVFVSVPMLVYLTLPMVIHRKWGRFRDGWRYLRLSDDGLELIRVDESAIRFEWGEIKKILENDDAYVLYYGWEEFFIIPKRTFEIEEHEIFFRDAILRRNAS